MPKTDWKSFSRIDADREYVALISFLPLKSFWKVPRFVLYTRAIERQLGHTNGLIGYSLSADLLKKEFLTLSVWEDENTLADFVKSGTHRETMSGLIGHLSEPKFVRWKIPGSKLPPSWQEAVEYLNTG